MIEDFARASEVFPDSEARFRWRVPEGWGQGRGAFGGLVLGAMTRAAQTLETDPARPLRVLTGELFGPVVVGDALIEVAALRRGNGLDTIEARLSQQGEVLARATFLFGKERTKDREWQPPAPARPDWREVPIVPSGPPFPEFAQFLHFRNTGGIPFSSAAGPGVAGFISFKVPLYYRADAPFANQGFVPEVRELWTEAGQLVALNTQTFAIIK
ncbi:MAG: thioesterase family protein [Deltaproteobacteria bacterium]|nr:thioesterase family protein [Deltaproteobacteria bacterium]